MAGGSYGTLRASANARGVSGPVDYNLDVTHFQINGYRDHSAAKRESGNAKLAFKVGDGGKLPLLVNTLALPDAQYALGLTPAQFDSDPPQVAAEMPSQRSRFQSIGPSSVNMRTFFSTIVQFDIISFMMAKTPIGSVSSAISGRAIREKYRKTVTG